MDGRQSVTGSPFGQKSEAKEQDKILRSFALVFPAILERFLHS